MDAAPDDVRAKFDELLARVTFAPVNPSDFFVIPDGQVYKGQVGLYEFLDDHPDVDVGLETRGT